MSTTDECGEPIPVQRKGRGMAAHNLTLLEHAVAIVEKMQPINVRGVAYQLFVQGALSSMALGNTQKVSKLLVYAREQGLIDWDDIVDESRQMERPLSFRNLSHFAAALKHSFRRDFWETQPYCVQVWSEKSTAGGILRPLLDRYGIPFLIVHGFGSATSVHDAADYSAQDSREQVILYCGDHDPSGMYMSDVDIPKRMEKYGGRVTVRRIALVSKDLPGLPSFDGMKKEDPRRRWYRTRYGVDAWELDALDPNLLRDRIEAAIEEYIDPEAWRRMELVNAAEQKTVHQVAEALTG